MSRDFDRASSQNARIGSLTIGYPFTLAFWFRIPTLPTVGEDVFSMMSMGSASANEYFDCQVRYTGAIRTQAYSAGNVNIEASNSVTTGAWQHFALVCASASSRRVILNGDWANSAWTDEANTPSVSRISLGVLWFNTDFYNYLEGLLAHAAWWNTDLSQAQIEGLAGTFSGGTQSGSGDNPLAVQNANLVSYWPLAGDASPEPDEKGSNDLTLYNSPTNGASDPTVDAAPGGGPSIQLLSYYYRNNED
jgi:Concanavalin A-like lectin/glucanases superfamily